MSGIETSLRAQKLNHLVNAAGDLLKSMSFHDITLDVIGKSVGMTKSNFYHYFRSKEELYLEVFLRKVERSVDVIESRLSEIEKKDDYEAVVEVLVKEFVEFEHYNEIASLVGTTLTRSISEAMTQNAQQRMQTVMLRSSKSLLKTMPSLSFFEAEKFLDYTVAIKNGLWSEYSASENYKKIFESFQGIGTDMSFEKEMRGALTILLKGLYANKHP